MTRPQLPRPQLPRARRGKRLALQAVVLGCVLALTLATWMFTVADGRVRSTADVPAAGVAVVFGAGLWPGEPSPYAESHGKAFGSYDPASLNYHTSQVRFEMGDLIGAVAAMQESDKLRYGIYRRTRVKERAILAERQLTVGHLEAACTTWGLALDDYPQVNSGRIDKRMSDMFRLIGPHLKNHDAQALYERARTIVRPELIPA